MRGPMTPGLMGRGPWAGPPSRLPRAPQPAPGMPLGPRRQAWQRERGQIQGQEWREREEMERREQREREEIQRQERREREEMERPEAERLMRPGRPLFWPRVEALPTPRPEGRAEPLEAPGRRVQQFIDQLEGRCRELDEKAALIERRLDELKRWAAELQPREPALQRRPEPQAERERSQPREP